MLHIYETRVSNGERVLRVWCDDSAEGARFALAISLEMPLGSVVFDALQEHWTVPFLYSGLFARFASSYTLCKTCQGKNAPCDPWTTHILAVATRHAARWTRQRAGQAWQQTWNRLRGATPSSFNGFENAGSQSYTAAEQRMRDAQQRARDARQQAEQARVREEQEAAFAMAKHAATLGLTWPCERAQVVRAFRRKILEKHPDTRGSRASEHDTKAASEVLSARDALLERLDQMGR